VSEKPARTAPDWERIEIEFRAGVFSVREIAKRNGVSHTAINKRAREEEWARDLQAKIRAKADALVSKREVSKTVSAETKITEQVTVEVQAQLAAEREIQQRGDSTEIRAASMAMIREHTTVGANLADIAQLGELLLDPSEKADEKRRELLDKVLSLPSRAASLKNAVDTAVKAIQVERLVHRMDATEGGNATGFEALVADL
jgi:hypothetical protein